MKKHKKGYLKKISLERIDTIYNHILLFSFNIKIYKSILFLFILNGGIIFFNLQVFMILNGEF